MKNTAERKVNNSPEIMEKIHAAIEQAKAEFKAGKVKVTISCNNNIKTGKIPSISIPPFISCPDICAKTCGPDCYAGKLVNLRTTCAVSWARNWIALLKVPSLYWETIRATAAMSTAFRYHVSGDIVNAEYFENMIAIARDFPGCHFLAFTKRYSVVNTWIDNNGSLPENMQIIFSEGWGIKASNPHNLPTSTVYEKGDTVNDSWILCGGDCTACKCKNTGCWTAKKGETIAFQNHR